MLCFGFGMLEFEGFGLGCYCLLRSPPFSVPQLQDLDLQANFVNVLLASIAGNSRVYRVLDGKIENRQSVKLFLFHT